jgi:hypothetical protein
MPHRTLASRLARDIPGRIQGLSRGPAAIVSGACYSLGADRGSEPIDETADGEDRQAKEAASGSEEAPSTRS